MPYLGTLQQALPYAVERVGSARASALITSVSSRNRLEVEAVFVLGGLAGDLESYEGTITRGTKRLIFEFSTAVNASALIKITQAGNATEFVCDPDGIAVADVV